LRAACTTTTLRGNHVLSPTPAWHSQGGGGLSPQAPRALCGAEREARLPVSSCRMLCKEAGACWQAKKTQWPCARATLLAGWCASASRSRRALQSAEAKLPAPQVILLRRASCMSRRLSYPRCSFALSPRPPRLQQRRQRAHQRAADARRLGKVQRHMAHEEQALGPSHTGPPAAAAQMRHTCTPNLPCHPRGRAGCRVVPGDGGAAGGPLRLHGRRRLRAGAAVAHKAGSCRDTRCRAQPPEQAG